MTSLGKGVSNRHYLFKKTLIVLMLVVMILMMEMMMRMTAVMAMLTRMVMERSVDSVWKSGSLLSQHQPHLHIPQSSHLLT